MLSDSRTSAGVDNISTYSKMWRYGVPGERQFILCSAGNLATTQAVVAKLERDIKEHSGVNLSNVTNLNAACEYIGQINVQSQQKNTGGGSLYESTFLLAGQIAGGEHALFLIYSQGNYIESSDQVPFLQIGEAKYGKPILDRVINPETSLDQAALCGLVSMDATIRSNLTVGPPIEVATLAAGVIAAPRYLSFDENDEYLFNLRLAWNKLMQESFNQLVPLVWSK